MAFRGCESWLTETERALLDSHLQTHVYLTAQAIARWVEERFEVTYSESGITAVLHRLGDVHKKPRWIPGKADPEAQKAFLAE